MADASTPGAPPGNRNVMIVLAYLWLLALVPLLVEKNDPEVQWHAKHGIVLMVAEIVLWIVIGILHAMITAVTAGLGCLLVLFFPILWILILVVHIVAIVKGINGKRLIIPGLSEYASRF